MLADNLKSATFAATTMAAEMVLSMSAMALGSGGKKGGTVTVYVEIFVGILFREIVKNQAPRNFRGFNFRDYVACLVVRPTYVQFLRFLFSRMQTNSRNTRKLIHRENFNVYGT